MIQRIQTLFLLAASLLAAGFLYFPFSAKIVAAGAVPGAAETVYRLVIGGVEASAGDGFLPVARGWLLPSLCLLTFLLPLFAVFQYRHRTFQVRLCWAAVLACLGVIVATYFISDRMGPAASSAGAVYLYAAYIPLVQFLFLRLAIHRIRHDEAMVRSADRIR